MIASSWLGRGDDTELARASRAVFCRIGPLDRNSHALYEPHDTGEGNRHRAGAHSDPLPRGTLSRQEHQGENDGQHRHLPELHTHIETHQCDRNLRTRKRDVAQGAGKAEAVHETKWEGDSPPPLPIANEPVLDAYISDGEGDARFDEARARRPETERRDGERDRVGDGERGDRTNE